MSDVDPAATRAELEHTGVLFTQNDADPGHIPAFWRKRIGELCDALDSGVVAGADTETPRPAAEEVAALTQSVRNVLAPTVEARLALAVLLVTEAVPRMQTLNNAASARWLPIAEKFLSGET